MANLEQTLLALQAGPPGSDVLWRCRGVRAAGVPEQDHADCQARNPIGCRRATYWRSSPGRRQVGSIAPIHGNSVRRGNCM